MSLVQLMSLIDTASPGQAQMNPDRQRRLSTLVDSTFDLSLKQLRSFLDRECADDPELRAEVERRVLERQTIGTPHDGSLATQDSLQAGDVVAERYRIARLIGRGGMGEVYEARDLLLNEDVAIKTLRRDLTGDEAIAQRFQTEIALARKVTHRNVCRIFEVGIHRSAERPPLLFFAMELLKGDTLSSRIRAGRLTRAEAFPIAVQLAEGLEAAHRAGIVHADFKSANVILVGDRGQTRAVITDFGLARLDPSGISLGAGTHAVASTARIAGTLAYMSPEQLAGDQVTTASDIYSFGIVLFEMASGERPFDDSDVIKAAMLRVGAPAVSVRARVPDIDDRWDTAITRCLQREPARRFASAGALANWCRDRSWWDVRYWTRRELVGVSAAACLVLAAAIGVWLWGHRPYQPRPQALRSYQIGVNALYSMTYETARKAFEQTVAIDPTFALAHASLARAYDELDYTDRAKDAMLRAVAAAQDSRLSADDERRLRALQFMVSRDYERAAPLIQQTETAARGNARAAAAVETGWLAQQMENSNAAAAAFERALTIDPSYAAAKLRLGFMFGRRGAQNDLALGLQAFTEAEQLYAAAGDYEGVTQTLLERANLLVRRSRQNEALPVIDKALAVAQTVGNRYQEIRLLLLQGTALRDLNDTGRATPIVEQAIAKASAENMDNLATNGQIDLANIYLRAGDITTAEPLFQRALQTARRAHVRRQEARAQLSLGSLYEQSRRPEDARPLIQSGLSFYREAGYRRESIQAAIVLGGVLQQLGENQDGIRILRETLPSTVQLQDRRSEAQLHERIADNLHDIGDWPGALAEYQRSLELQPSPLQVEYTRMTIARSQRRLGLREDADRSLDQTEQFSKNHPDARLRASIVIERAEMAYSEGRFQDVVARLGSLPRDQSGDIDRQSTSLRSRIFIRTGRIREGLALATTQVEALERTRLPGSAAAERLAFAEALVAVGERESALTMSRAALDYLQPKESWEGIWRGHMIAARASAQRADADAHETAARAALMQLRTGWTAPAVDRYLGRPDVESLVRGVRF